MPRLNTFLFDDVIDTDKLNQNFLYINDDITDIFNRIKYLDNLYTEKSTQEPIITKYRAKLIEAISQSIPMSGVEDSYDMLYFDPNSPIVTISNIKTTYNTFMLRNTISYDRFPESVNNYGEIVPIYDGVEIYKNNILVDKNDNIYYVVTNNKKRIYIEQVDNITSYINYKFKSNANTPLINCIEISPVFGGLCSISNLKYGVGTVSNNIFPDNRTLSPFYGGEYVFKQSNNSEYISFDITPTSIDTNKYVGLYKVKGYYREYVDSGYVEFDIDVLNRYLSYLYINYDFLSPSINYSIFKKILRLEISTNDGISYDYDTDDAFTLPIINKIDLTGISKIRIRLTLRKYEDITPIVKYLKFGFSS